MPPMICLSAYDALLIVADISQLITNIRKTQIEVQIEVMFSPMFKVANVSGCYKLSVNGSYAQIFDQPVVEFLNNDVIAGISPLLESNEQSKSCPNETDAKMVAIFMSLYKKFMQIERNVYKKTTNKMKVQCHALPHLTKVC